MQLGPLLVDRPLFGVAFAVVTVIFVGNLVALGYWARAEATACDGTVLGTFMYLATGIGILHYVWVRYVRNDWEPRLEPAGRRERLVTAYSLALTLALVVGALLTPPDPITQILALPLLFAGSFVVSYLFVTQRADSASGVLAD